MKAKELFEMLKKRNEWNELFEIEEEVFLFYFKIVKKSQKEIKEMTFKIGSQTLELLKKRMEDFFDSKDIEKILNNDFKKDFVILKNITNLNENIKVFVDIELLTKKEYFDEIYNY